MRGLELAAGRARTSLQLSSAIRPEDGSRYRGFVRRAVPISRRRQVLLAIGLYSILAFVVCGASNPLSSSRMPMCACTDAAQEVWFLAWPAYALAHFTNPFVTNFAAYPRGLNLMSGTSMELLGLLSSPLTLISGPVASFNLLLRVAFAGSATSMFLVLRHYVRAWPAALAGGLLYGFSPFMFNEGYTHLFLVFLPLPPIVLLLAEDLLGTRRWRPLPVGVLLGVVSAAQMLISAETLAITLVMAGAGIVLATIRHPLGAKERVRRAAAGLAPAAIVFVMLAAYPVWMFLAGPQHVSGPQHQRIFYSSFHDDLFGTVVPTSTQLIAPHSLAAVGNRLTQTNPPDHVTYIGVTLLLLLAYITIRFRKVGLISLSAALGGLALVVSLGPTLFVDGNAYVKWLRLPYDVLLHFPLLREVLATRFEVAVYLFAAIVLALGLDKLLEQGWRSAGQRGTTHRRFSFGRSATCAVVCAAALLPLVPDATYTQSGLPVPQFFYDSSLLGRIPAGSVVLPYPNAQRPTVKIFASPHVESMMWQAVTKMHFRIIGAYAVQPYKGGLGLGSELFDPPAVVQQFFAWALYGSPTVAEVRATPSSEAALRVLCRREHVSTILVEPGVGAHPGAVVRYVEAALGRPAQTVGGLDAWFDVAAHLVGRA